MYDSKVYDPNAYKRIKSRVWKLNKRAERDTDTHPCNHHNPDTCDCKGACSCHWVRNHNLPKVSAVGVCTSISGGV